MSKKDMIERIMKVLQGASNYKVELAYKVVMSIVYGVPERK